MVDVGHGSVFCSVSHIVNNPLLDVVESLSSVTQLQLQWGCWFSTFHHVTTLL